MKNPKVALAALCFLVTVGAASFPVSAEVIDKIIVVVNNEVITQGELDRMLVPLYQRYSSMYQGSELISRLDEARQAILSQIIEEKLILGEAKKLNIEVDEKDVAAKLEESQKRFGSRELFERALAEQRMTPRDLKNKLREQLMIRKLIDQKVGSKIIMTPVDVSEYYRKHMDEFVQPEEVKLWNILIRTKEGADPAKAAELAAQVQKQLKEGGDFASLAKANSEGPGAADGGLMGYKKRGDLLPEIEEVIFRLKAGEVSDVIKTSIGYFIFKVEEKRPAKSMSLSEARRLIEDAIFKEKAKEKMKGWVEGLKESAYIAFK